MRNKIKNLKVGVTLKETEKHGACLSTGANEWERERLGKKVRPLILSSI